MLAIVGGSGRLPDILAETSPGAHRHVPHGMQFGCGENSAEAFRFEQLGSLVDQLKRATVDRIVFAGAMRRPDLDVGLLDEFTLEAMSVLAPALGHGDDALLRGVISVFEGAGFQVIAAHEVLPELLPPVGVITAAAPDNVDRSDTEKGLAVLDALATFDIGQACAVAGGQVLAIETIGGTDWMLGTLAAETPGRSKAAGRRGVLCKAPKSGQERRIDLPAIGPGTVQAASAARLRGISIEAEGVMILDRDETIAAADRENLFIWVTER
jgi:DUF1009 family protein